MNDRLGNVKKMIVATDKGVIDYGDVKNRLEEEGYGFCCDNEDKDLRNIKLIKTSSNIIEQVSTSDIANFLDPLIPGNALNNWYKETTITGQGFSFYKKMKRYYPEIYKDEKDSIKLFFKDKIVNVTSKKVTYLTYDEIDLKGKKIWSSNISPKYFDPKHITKWDKNDWYKFSENCVGKENIDYLMRAIGYMVHTHKDKGFAKMVVLAEESGEEGRNGGTGKGLQIQMLEKIRTLSLIDGKLFDPSKEFSMSGINEDNNIVVLNDIKYDFKYGDFYNIITDGLALRKMRKNMIHIPFERSPKWIATTNFGVLDTDSSDLRRRIVVPFSNYYSDKRTPADEFTKMFFDDWNDEDYSLFFSYVVKCCQMYLQDSAETHSAEGLYMKGVSKFIPEDFSLFVIDNWNDLSPQKWSIDKLRQEFPFSMQTKDVNTFLKALKIACKSMNIDIDRTSRITDLNGKQVRAIVLTKIGEPFKNENVKEEEEHTTDNEGSISDSNFPF